MAQDKIKVKFKGTVSKNYETEDGKRVLHITISKETAEKLYDKIADANYKWDGTSNAIKIRDDGSMFVKVSSGFGVECSGDADEIEEVGQGSEVTAYAVLVEGKYQKKRYVSCYVSAITVWKLEELIPYSAFEDDEYEDL